MDISHYNTHMYRREVVADWYLNVKIAEVYGILLAAAAVTLNFIVVLVHVVYFIVIWSSILCNVNYPI